MDVESSSPRTVISLKWNNEWRVQKNLKVISLEVIFTVINPSIPKYLLTFPLHLLPPFFYRGSLSYSGKDSDSPVTVNCRNDLNRGVESKVISLSIEMNGFY